MRSIAAVAGLLVFLGGVGQSSGKDAKDTHESIFEEMIKMANDYVAIIDGVKDEATAKDAKPKLEGLSKKAKDLKKRADALPKPSDEEQKRLAQKFLPELLKLGPKMQAAQKKQMMYEALKGIKFGM